MKIYSSDAISRDELVTIRASTAADIDAIDIKQTKQINTLRKLLLISFVVNAALAIGMRFV